jgi:hypothetical protein
MHGCLLSHLLPLLHIVMCTLTSPTWPGTSAQAAHLHQGGTCVVAEGKVAFCNAHATHAHGQIKHKHMHMTMQEGLQLR